MLEDVPGRGFKQILPLAISLLLILSSSFTLRVFASSSYQNSNSGIQNILASQPVTGGATDSTGACVTNALYNNHHSESWIAADPTNPTHLVAMSKFFFDPEHYLFHVGSYVSRDAGQHWKDQIVPGFDCQSNPSNSWVDSTDPVLAFDSQGNVYSVMQPYSFKYNPDGHQVFGVVPNDAIFIVKSTDGGDTWKIANQQLPLAIYNSSGTGRTADKQWIAVDTNMGSPFRDSIYVAWTVFAGGSSEIWFSKSTDHAEHFTAPVRLSRPNNDGPVNTFVFPGVGPDGTLYVSYTSFPANKSPQADDWVLKSKDGGQTFSTPILAATFTSVAALPNTTFRDGIADNFAVNPKNGHLLLTLEVDSGNGVDVQLTESMDGGSTWTHPITVNDLSTVHDGTDQFQPTVSASPRGTVAVTFYDRRLSCPLTDPNILQADQGRANFCINTSIQFYKDNANGLQAIGSNIRVTSNTWDPQNPGSTGHLPLPGGPLTTTTFVGDYFGLTLTTTNAYVLFASNYNLGNSQGLNPNNDQQQILGIVPIPSV